MAIELLVLSRWVTVIKAKIGVSAFQHEFVPRVTRPHPSTLPSATTGGRRVDSRELIGMCRFQASVFRLRRAGIEFANFCF